MIDDWANYAIAESEAFYRFQVMAENGKQHQGEAISILNSKAQDKGIVDWIFMISVE